MLSLRTAAALLATLAVASPLAFGCSDGATAGDEDNLKPEAAKTLFEQAQTCEKILRRHSTIRETDLKEGTIRWNCADVAGVTGDDRGQEYCEYHAVSAGKVVTSIAEIEGGKLSCMFVGVFKDTAGKDAELSAALGSPENLGVATIDPELVRMQKGFNARHAASKLVTDCQNGANEAPIDETRQAACFQASLVGGKAGDALRKACDGKDLTKEEAWAKAEKLGAKVAVPGEPEFDSQRDIAACLRTHIASPSTWRNSDTMICGRVVRGTGECGCAYADIPEAVDGFSFTGWTNEQLPTGCRYADVGGEPYRQLVICETNQGEIEDIELNPAWSEDLKGFCHDRFSTELVMKAPLRDLQQPDTCQTHSEFCSAYVGTGAAD